jgi:SHS2 domain-containing protein
LVFGYWSFLGSWALGFAYSFPVLGHFLVFGIWFLVFGYFLVLNFWFLVIFTLSPKWYNHFYSPMENEFEIIDHTADVGIRAYGADMQQAFANAAKAMFSLITDLDAIRLAIHRDVEIAAPDRETLLVQWLNELIYIFDVERLLFKRFDIISITPTAIRARCYGEKVDKSRHEIKTGIKSATYHQLQVEDNGGCRVQVYLDI